MVRARAVRLIWIVRLGAVRLVRNVVGISRLRVISVLVVTVAAKLKVSMVHIKWEAGYFLYGGDN